MTINATNVCKSFPGEGGEVVALDDVSIDVPDGSVHCVYGPAGAGKSTLARLLSLRDRPDRGVIRLEGHDTTTLTTRELRAVRRCIGVLPPDDTLVEQRTVAGNVALPLERSGVAGPTRRTKVGRLLDVLDLTGTATYRPAQLTAGQRRRVSMARALIREPGVLLADEPTAGLGAAEEAGLLAVLDRVGAELGATVLVTTGEAGVVRRIAQDVAVLSGGRLRESGAVLDLLRRRGGELAALLLPDPGATTDLAAARYDRIRDVVLVGFAAVGALLPEADARFGVHIAVLGGGLTRIRDVPVARFRIGVCGERADAALAWIEEFAGLGGRGGSPAERRNQAERQHP
jgi:D-methionine transport system ATP-binding protein